MLENDFDVTIMCIGDQHGKLWVQKDGSGPHVLQLWVEI